MILLKNILKKLIFEAKGDKFRPSGWDKIINQQTPLSDDEYWDLHAEMESNPTDDRKKEIEQIMSKSIYRSIRQQLSNDVRWNQMPMDDVLSIAIQVGLPYAFKTMDWKKGTKFATNAYWKVIGALTKEKEKLNRNKNKSDDVEDEESYIYQPKKGDLSLDTAFNFGDGDEGSMHDIIPGSNYDYLDQSVLDQIEGLWKSIIKKLKTGREREKWKGDVVEYYIFDEAGNFKNPSDRLVPKQVDERLMNDPKYGNKKRGTIQNFLLKDFKMIENGIMNYVGIEKNEKKKKKDKEKKNKHIQDTNDELEDNFNF